MLQRETCRPFCFYLSNGPTRKSLTQQVRANDKNSSHKNRQLLSKLGINLGAHQECEGKRRKEAMMQCSAAMHLQGVKKNTETAESLTVCVTVCNIQLCHFRFLCFTSFRTKVSLGETIHAVHLYFITRKSHQMLLRRHLLV